MYLVMEYCEGGDLFDALERQVKAQGSYTEDDAAMAVKTILLAINHCHAHGICHRDLKPENIMIGKGGQLKIIDFGLSQVQVKGEESEIKTKVGSPFYVAPEILQGKPYSPQVDIWAVGVILYTMLTGFMPFGGEDMKELFKSIIEQELDLT